MPPSGDAFCEEDVPLGDRDRLLSRLSAGGGDTKSKSVGLV
jgi:hypothetical protein